MLQHDNREYRFRVLQRLLADAAAGVSAQMMPDITRMVEDKDERIRIKCIQVLAQKPTSAAVDLLLERLTQEGYRVKTAITQLLDDFMRIPELNMVDRLLPQLSQGDG